MVSEVERKYEVPLDFSVTGDALGAAVGEPARHELVAVYYDTEDLRLAADRVALRRRTGGHDAGWHVKRYGDGDERDEVQLPAGRGSTVPAAVAAEVRAVSRGGALRPTVRIRTARTEWPLLDAAGNVAALVADDDVTTEVIADPDSAKRWREVEVELAGGDRSLLKTVDKRLRRAGARRSADPAKLARALDGRWPDDVAAGGPDGSSAAVVGAYVRAQRDTLVTYDPKVRRDEPDSVHKMRVATRRLRSTLKTFRPLWDRERSDALRAELKWLAEVLGVVRDAEVMADRLTGELDALPDELVVGPVRARLVDGLSARTVRGRRALIAALNGPRYAALLDSLDALLAAPPTGHGLAPAADWVPRRVRRVVGKVDGLLDTAEKAAPGSALPLPGVLDRNTALHEARKSAKQARYAAEAAAPLGGPGPAALSAALEDLQELLGDQHDSVVTRDLLRAEAMRAHAAGENAFTYGLLHGQQAGGATDVEAGLPAARAALARKKATGWLGR